MGPGDRCEPARPLLIRQSRITHHARTAIRPYHQHCIHSRNTCLANASAYHASKWGLVGFSRGLGVEGRKDGIHVTTIIPGGMRTHFFDRFVEQGIPMPEERNLQEPANVADVIVFAAQVPPESALQEVLITPLTETSWP